MYLTNTPQKTHFNFLVAHVGSGSQAGNTMYAGQQFCLLNTFIKLAGISHFPRHRYRCNGDGATTQRNIGHSNSGK